MQQKTKKIKKLQKSKIHSILFVCLFFLISGRRDYVFFVLFFFGEGVLLVSIKFFKATTTTINKQK